MNSDLQYFFTALLMGTLFGTVVVAPLLIIAFTT